MASGRLVRSDSRDSVFSTSSCVSGVGGWQVGDRARINDKSGTIAFIGNTKFAVGEWIGLVLDEPTGKNDGSIDGTKYFTCNPQHGLFVKAGKLTRIAMSPARFKSPTPVVAISRHAAEYGFDVGDRVIISAGKVGTLRFLDETTFASGVWAGVELDQAQGKNDGSVQGKRYFTCKPQFGIFVSAKNIQKAPVQLPAGVHHNKASILRTELGQSKKTGSRESLNSIGRSSIASSRFGMLRKSASRVASTSDEGAVRALQQALEEKERHIEQLMAERELVDYSHHPAENAERLKKLEEKTKTANELIHSLKSELASKKKEVDDLRFQIEEENVTKQCEIEELQQKIVAIEESGRPADVNEQDELAQKLRGVEAELVQYRASLKTEQGKYSQLQSKLDNLGSAVQELDEERKKAKGLEEQLEQKAHEIEDAKKEREELIGAVTQKDADLVAHQEKLKIVSSQQGSAVSELTLKVEELEAALKDKNSVLIAFEQEKTNLTEKLEQRDGSLLALQKDVADLTNTVSQKEVELKGFSEEVAGLEQSLLAKDVDASNLKTEIEQLTALNAQREEEQHKMVEAREVLQAKVRQIEEELQTKTEMLEQAHTAAKMSGTEMSSQLATINEQMDALTKEKRSLEEELSKNTKAHEDLLTENSVAKKTIEETAASLTEAQNKLAKRDEELSGEIRDLRELLDTIGQQKQQAVDEGTSREEALQQKLDKTKEQLVQQCGKTTEVKEKLQSSLDKLNRERETLKTALDGEIAKLTQEVEREKMTVRDLSEAKEVLSIQSSRFEEDLTASKSHVEKLKEELLLKAEQLSAAVAEKDKIQRELRGSQDAYTALQSSVESFKLGESSMAQDLATVKEEAARRVAEVESLQKQLEASKEQVGQMTTEIEELKVSLEEMTTKMRGLEDASSEEIRKLERSLANETTLRSKLEAEVCSKAEEIASLKSKLDETTSNVADASDKTKELLANNEKMSALVNELNQQLSMRQQEVDNFTKAMDQHKIDLSAREEVISRANEKIHSLEEQVTHGKSSLEEYKEKVSGLEAAAANAQKELDGAASSIGGYEGETRELKEKLAEKEAAIELVRKEAENVTRERSELLAKYEQLVTAGSSSDDQHRQQLIEKEAKLRQLQESHKGAVEKLTTDLGLMGKEASVTKELLEKKETELEQIRGDLKEKEGELEKISAELVASQTFLEANSQQLSELRTASDSAKESETRLAKEVEEMRVEKLSLKQEVEDLTMQLAGSTSSQNNLVETYQATTGHLESQVKELMERLKEKEEAVATTESRMNSQDEERREHIGQLEENISTLTKELETLQASKAEAHLDQMTTEFGEAMGKIRQLSEDKMAMAGQLDAAKDETAKLQVDLLAMRKELLDAQIEASEATKRMELAEELRVSLEQKNVRLVEEVDSLRNDEVSAELDFLRKIVANKEAELTKLRNTAELALSPQALVDRYTPKKKVVTKRMFCDMCEQFDVHETIDCPLQASEAAEAASHSHHATADGSKKAKPAPREYCDTCEEFDHSTENCPKSQRKKRDYTF